MGLTGNDTGRPADKHQIHKGTLSISFPPHAHPFTASLNGQVEGGNLQVDMPVSSVGGTCCPFNNVHSSHTVATALHNARQMHGNAHKLSAAMPS